MSDPIEPTRQGNAADPYFDDVPGVGMVFNTGRWLEAKRNGTLTNDKSVVTRLYTEADVAAIIAATASEVRENNDHIVPGGDGYSAGFHYALHCMSAEPEGYWHNVLERRLRALEESAPRPVAVNRHLENMTPEEAARQIAEYFARRKGMKR